MTTLEKFAMIAKSATMSFSSPYFEEMRKVENDEVVAFVPSSGWEADVTFYIRGKAAIYRQSASFVAISFEALVEKIWAAYHEVYKNSA